ncbi:MAG: hypothetical protein HY885_06140 [Deltaproteobacteria bacterium]|nr:hypothetical protein [Deltaproteobacteria bacterium]
MSIKMLALDLYRAQQRVRQLETRLDEETPPGGKDAVSEELREALAELRQLRNMLEGAKSPSPYRTLSTWGKGKS